jgi:hypothetical protein
VMATIASKTKEIVVVQDEQQRISELATNVIDKALIFYTQLTEMCRSLSPP